MTRSIGAYRLLIFSDDNRSSCLTSPSYLSDGGHVELYQHYVDLTDDSGPMGYLAVQSYFPTNGQIGRAHRTCARDSIAAGLATRYRGTHGHCWSRNVGRTLRRVGRVSPGATAAPNVGPDTAAIAWANDIGPCPQSAESETLRHIQEIRTPKSTAPGWLLLETLSASARPRTPCISPSTVPGRAVTSMPSALRTSPSITLIDMMIFR